jgi:hypothetical protein
MEGVQMSDTPRTDDQIGYDGSTMTLIRIEFTKQLERELNKANDRIKRLEEGGDEAIYKTNLFDRESHWNKTKEAK